MQIKEIMKKEVTVGNLILAFAPILLIVITWGNTIETRFTEHSIRITNTERSNAKTEVHQEKMLENQLKILIALENKIDRKK